MASLRARALAAVADLDLETLATARWTGFAGLRTARIGLSGEVDTAPGADQPMISLIDAFEVPGGGGVAIVGVTGMEIGRVDGRSGGETIRLTVPLDGPGPWIGLHRLASRGGAVPGLLGGRLTGRPGRASPAGESRADGRGGASAAVLGRSLGPGPSWRAAPGDQSHTSAVIDEQFMLKLYRRLAPGPNPEGELLAALDGVAGAPVPGWVGSVEFESPVASTGASRTGPERVQPTTIAIDQCFIAGSDDAFEVLADQLAAWLAAGGPPPTTELIGATGRAMAALHLRMARIPVSQIPTEGRLVPTDDDRRRWLEAAERTLDQASAALGSVDADLATRLALAEPAIRLALRPIGDSALPVAIQRIHGDLHLGQILNTQDGVLIVDFEGDPTRDALTRREPAPSLRDVADFLRSIDHVARSGRRRAVALGAEAIGAEAIDLDLDAAVDAWIESARGAFLAGYRTGLDDPAWQPNRALLRAFEVEKELSELIYASRFLPTWLYAPRSGMNALLGGVL